MKCPFCGSYNNRITNTRDVPDGTVRRRRHCYTCGKSFRTFETPWINDHKIKSYKRRLERDG